MTFADLIGQIRGSPLTELRACRSDYLEAVVASSQMGLVKGILFSYFGDPFKPEGEPTFPEADSYAEAYGGVAKSQTLYLNPDLTTKEVALVWPWGSGLAVTLKIARG
jgi:hypothetical protein